MNNTRLSSILLFAALILTTHAHAEDDPVVRFSETIVAAVGGQIVDCSTYPRKLGKDQKAVCADVGLQTDVMRKTWDKEMKKRRMPVEVDERSNWLQQKNGGLKRYYFVDIIPTVVMLEPESPDLIFAYRPPKRCEGEWAKPLSCVQQDNRECPTVIEKVPADFPKKERKKGRAGSVVLVAEIRDNATVGEICYLENEPNSPWFLLAAMQAVSQWVFDPGTEDGEPTTMRFSTRIEFKPRSKKQDTRDPWLEAAWH